MLNNFRIPHILCNNIEIHNVSNDPVVIVKIGEARIIEGYQKFVHAINITDIEQSISQIESHISTVNISHPELITLLKRKTDDLRNNIKQLKPRRKQKRWDALGRAWKWMSGSPDADDLRIITKGINEMVDNSNKQIKINDQVFDSLGNLTEITNKLINITEQNSKLSSEETQVLHLILNLDIINQEIASIQEAIIFAKLGTVNYKLLTTDEIIQIDELLSNQGMHLDLLEEAINFAKVTIGTNNELLLYVVNIPKFYHPVYEVLKIEAILKNSQRIHLKGNIYLRNKNELLLQKTPCERLGNWSLCYQSDVEDISDDNCVSKLARGTESKCTYEHNPKHPSVTKISETTALLNDINTNLQTTCGISNRKLTGSFMIMYQNCSITIGEHTLTNNVIKTVNQRIFIPSTGLKVKEEGLERKFDIHTLHQVQHQHLKQLQHLKSATAANSWSLIGGFSFSTSIIIFIIIFVMFKFRSQGTFIQIDRSNTSPIEAPTATKDVQYYQPASTIPAGLTV